jgi:hypothetical protein
MTMHHGPGEQQCIVGKLSSGRDQLQNTKDKFFKGRVQRLSIGKKVILVFPPSWKMRLIYGIALYTFGRF